MTDIVDEIIAVIEAGGGRNDPELGIVLPPTPAFGDERDWKDVVALALAHVVEQRWEAKAREKAKWAAASPGHWVWEDEITGGARGTDGEYVAKIVQGYQCVSATVARGETVIAGATWPDMARAKVAVEERVAHQRGAPVTTAEAKKAAVMDLTERGGEG